MKIVKVASVLILLAAAITVMVLKSRSPHDTREIQRQETAPSIISEETVAVVPSAAQVIPAPTNATPAIEVTEAKPAPVTNKLERLRQIRETFRALAAGDKVHAMREAKQIVNETERETALLTLVTEWTGGELSAPGVRAQRIASLGLEAGLGIELGQHPELAAPWATELTDGPGRAALLQEAARHQVATDPAAAFALMQQLPEAERSAFTESLLASWATRDTEAALRWAEQYGSPEEREAALQAIRNVAPVGIGTALAIQDGYPVIRDLFPGTPAERSGQLQVGDRILALAQADGAFIDLHEAPLADIVRTIRGAPNTILQLKVVPAGAAPNTTPRTIVIMRDQIKFKK